MNCIKIKRIWSDETMIELEFSASSLNVFSQLKFYVTEYQIMDLKKKLLKFPINKDDSINWVVGSRKENSYVYFKFKTYLFNKSGHVAIEIEMDNKLEQPYALCSHFYILTEVASINELGKNIDKLLIEDDVCVEGVIFRN